MRSVQEQNQASREKLVREWLSKSTHQGDYYWRKAQSMTGLADYTEADHGEAPQGAQW